MNNPAWQHASVIDNEDRHACEAGDAAGDAAVDNRVTAFPRVAVAVQPAPARSAWRRRWLLALLALIVLVIVWVALRGGSTATPASGAPATAAAPLELASVDVVTAAPRVLARNIPISGSIGPVVQATVRAKVSGEVEAVTVREGQDVAAGDVIARIDTRNLQAQYERELAAVDKARADLDLATLNRDKNRKLLEERFISQTTFEQSESAYAASVANLKLAEAQARLAKIALEDAVVRAPFPGTIARRLVQPGEKVSPDSAIVQLVDLRQMLLEAPVPAADIPAVAVGQLARFNVNGFGGREFEGQVQRINPMTTEGSRAITIYVALANADLALKGGMFAQGQLTIAATQPVLAVPRQAVKYDAGMPYVHTLTNGKIARQPIVIGTQTEGEGFVEVREGLQQGDRVIVADVGDRKPGDAAIVRGEG